MAQSSPVMTISEEFMNHELLIRFCTLLVKRRKRNGRRLDQSEFLVEISWIVEREGVAILVEVRTTSRIVNPWLAQE